ncbi:SDR family oxidoreductase [Bradyrhizobium brasilense]|uniref:SDR family oxidoreductase n=1 Tax=Bradyrhizobium brasilense TaxID=1419277 RepID=UPI00145713EA|nr:SDR family oxidoreductase [Bradyrhizobium brasilense]NLS75163.1 SDR family oxidoreductase [Bradyrhizobium brasilense]
MDLGVRGKTALVLGAGGGLGSAIAKALALEGVRVALAGRSSWSVQRTCDDIVASGGEALPLVWDLAGLSAIDAHVGAIEAKFGLVDILVNNSGGPPSTPASGQYPECWSKHFQSMVLSIIAITDRVLPGMRSKKWGRVITSSSSGVVAPISNLGISNALRLSLVGWSKTLAREVGRDGITVNIVLPGRIATPRIAFLDEQKANREGRPVEQIAAESMNVIALSRYGEPEEYGDTVALASQRASYMTGSVIRIDGGLITSN